MIFSYVTHSKKGDYYFFEFKQESTGRKITVKFLPNSKDVFDKSNLDISKMKLRDLEVLLLLFSEYGLVRIVKGLY